MSIQHTSQDVDRLLGFADQFLENMAMHAGENESEATDAECEAAAKEFAEIRPLLVAAPDMAEALGALLATKINPEDQSPWVVKARAALAKAGGA